MKTICLYFEIHQIIHLKRYRFFDIGTDHYYYDDYENERSITDIVERSYMPALTTLEQMIKENGDFFKFALSLSGVAIEQMELHAPQVLEKLQDRTKQLCRVSGRALLAWPLFAQRRGMLCHRRKETMS